MQLFILAPSAHLDSTSIIDVANVLLNMKFIETAEIQEHLFSTSYEPPSPSTSRLSFTFTAEGKVMCEYYHLFSTSYEPPSPSTSRLSFTFTAEGKVMCEYYHLFSTSYEPPSPFTSRLSFTFTAEGKVMCEYYHRFLGLREKEASGTLLLGVFVVLESLPKLPM